MRGVLSPAPVVVSERVSTRSTRSTGSTEQVCGSWGG